MRQQQYNNNQAQKRKYREELEHQHKFDIEKAKLEEKRQEQLDDIKKQLNDEKKARLNQPQPNTPQPNPSYSPQPNTPAVDYTTPITTVSATLSSTSFLLRTIAPTISRN